MFNKNQHYGDVQLDQLKSLPRCSKDTGDFGSLKQYTLRQSVARRALAASGHQQPKAGGALLKRVIDRAAGLEIWKIVDVSTATMDNAPAGGHQFIEMYETHGHRQESGFIKIA